MTDIHVQPDRYGRYDAQLAGGDLVADDTLRPAVLTCLLTDRQATPEQLAAAGRDPADARGWWGDCLNDDPTYRWGSLLWLLEGAPIDAELPAKADGYAQDALQILVRLGVAKSVSSASFLDADDELVIPVAITKPDGSIENYRFEKLWTESLAIVGPY